MQPAQTEDALSVVATVAERAGCELFAGPEESRKHAALGEVVRPADELDGPADICIVLGGDGSILRALRRTAGTDTPVFGFNFGTVGFLAATERADLSMVLERAFAGEFEVMALPGLRAEVDVEHPVGLNDISLLRRPERRVAELSYSVGGAEIADVRCDGIVAATPAGSTGYNLANGGPILAWGVGGYVVSFVAPHTLTGRAIVIAPGDVLTVRNAAGREPVDIVFDGVHEAELESGASLDIGFHDDVARLAQLPGSSFYRRVLEKFGPLAR
ncbi:MAG: NAD(+)/NADH kinase [Solirubrobacterales bacterium]|nr:NAD(+)/NADH kinase [Solirubrobacterales bacterium]